MAALKLKYFRARLKGGSLIEVIVASVLVLVCFLIFSLVLDRVYLSRPIVPQLHFLYTAPAINDEGIIEFSNRLKPNCNRCRLSFDNDAMTIKVDGSHSAIEIQQFCADTLDEFTK